MVVCKLVLIFACLCCLTEIDALSATDVVINTLKMEAKQLAKGNNNDTECVKQIKLVIQGIMDGEMWALETIEDILWVVFDASAKLQPGIATGNVNQLGNFDQCLDIRGPLAIKGQYCKATIFPSQNYSNALTKMADLDYAVAVLGYNDSKAAAGVKELISPQFDVCLPAACSTADLQKVWDGVERRYKVPIHLEFVTGRCISQEILDQIPTRDVIIMAFFGFMGFILVISTVYDVVIFQKKPDKSYNILMSFSLYTNTKRLLSSKDVQDKVTCLDGIRSISIIWIVVSHRVMLNYSGYALNTVYILEWMKHWENMVYIGSFSSVDTFFFISGFLVVYVIMNMREKNMRVNWLVFILHRYIRLTPLLLAVLLLYVGVLYHLGRGPYWIAFDEFLRQQCLTKWWNTLLYIQNYNEPFDICISQSWYIAVDTQLYVAAPLLLIPLLKYPKPTIGLIFLLISFSATDAGYITWYKEYGVIPLRLSFVKDLYIATQIRMSPWLVGTLFGYYMFKVKNKKVSIGPVMNQFLWLASFGSMLLIVFGKIYFLKYDYYQSLAVVHNAFSPILWALDLCWIVFACTRNTTGIVNRFLSHHVFLVLSRLNYSLYLLHLCVISLIYSRQQTPEYIDNIKSMHHFWGDYVFSVFVAALFSLTFESPVTIMEKMLLKREKNKKKSETDKDGQSAESYVVTNNKL